MREKRGRIVVGQFPNRVWPPAENIRLYLYPMPHLICRLRWRCENDRRHRNERERDLCAASPPAADFGSADAMQFYRTTIFLCANMKRQNIV
jgi:hypothetical protein